MIRSLLVVMVVFVVTSCATVGTTPRSRSKPDVFSFNSTHDGVTVSVIGITSYPHKELHEAALSAGGCLLFESDGALKQATVEPSDVLTARATHRPLGNGVVKRSGFIIGLIADDFLVTFEVCVERVWRENSKLIALILVSRGASEDVFADQLINSADLLVHVDTSVNSNSIDTIELRLESVERACESRKSHFVSWTQVRQ